MNVDWDQKLNEFKDNGYVKVSVGEISNELCNNYSSNIVYLNKFIDNYGFEANANRNDWGWSEHANIEKQHWGESDFSEPVDSVLRCFQSIAQKVSIRDSSKKFKDVDGVQLTFRHKGHCPEKYNAHLDGGGDYRENKDAMIKRHSVIGGILLSEMGSVDSGETVYWGKSHDFVKNSANAFDKAGLKDPRILKYNIKKMLDKDNKLGGSSGPTPILGDIGDMFFFHFATLHGTNKNLKNVVRRCLFHRFKIGEEMKCGEKDGMGIYQQLFWWDESL